jgi:phospholipid/cholesterol/gamma-HCH transport system substrate-binding protein
MNENQLQFRVGLFVVLSAVGAFVLVLQFGNIQSYWKETYAIAIQFDEAPGIRPGSPVRLNGLPIGVVRDVVISDEEPGVICIVDIESERKLRKDSKAALVRSLFGDATVEFTPGSSREFIPPNKKLRGLSPVDPLASLAKLEVTVSKTLSSFNETSDEWKMVGRNLNGLMDTKSGQLDEVIERAALSLASFSETMKTANQTLTSANALLGDPEVQQNLKQTIASLPLIVAETQQTIALTRQSIQKVSENLDKINAATDPLAKQSESMVAKLDGSLGQLESLLTELNMFSKNLNHEDGTLQQLASNPELYQNLNRSSSALATLLTNLTPVLADVRIFSDRIARHPEILGVSGAMKPSSGVKDAALEEGVRPAGYATPGKN